MTDSLSYEFATAHRPGTALTISLEGFLFYFFSFPGAGQWLLPGTERSLSGTAWTREVKDS